MALSDGLERGMMAVGQAYRDACTVLRPSQCRMSSTFGESRSNSITLHRFDARGEAVS